MRKVRALFDFQIAHRFEPAPPWRSAGGVNRLNPMHEVLVLQLSDGTLICDQGVIVQYLDADLPELPPLPHAVADRIEAQHTEDLVNRIDEAVAPADRFKVLNTTRIANLCVAIQRGARLPQFEHGGPLARSPRWI